MTMTYPDFQPTRLFQPTVALSPDGSLVAYSDNGSGQFNLVVQPTGGGPARRLTDYTENAVRTVRWQPDGAALVFTADSQGDEFYQIHRVAAGGGPVEALTDAPKVRHYLMAADPFSPDGRLLAYAANDRAETDQDVLVRDMTTGQTRRLAQGDTVYFSGPWSPDGGTLCVLEFRSNTDFEPFLVAAGGGGLRPVLPGGEAKRMPVGWSADGGTLYVVSDAGRDTEALVGVEVAGGAVTEVDAPQWDVEAAELSADRRVLVWVVNVDGASRLRARDVVSGRDLPVPELPVGVVGALSVSGDGGRVALLLSTGTRPNNVALVDLAAGTFRWLTDAAPVGAAGAALVEPVLVRYPTHDGRDVPAYLYRPAGDGPFGVVLSIHGGPEAQERAAYNYGGMYQYLASRGVGVLAPNVRGSTGYGTAYQKLIHHDWGGGELRDFEHAVAYLRGLDWVDPARIGVFGGSFGGFATLSCVSRLPQLWAAGVSVVGPSNLVTFTRAVPPTWRRHMAEWVGDPDTETEFLMARSPISYADQIVAPLLVIQGANDPRVVRAESDQIVASLRERGVQVRYDVYDDEGHGFTKKENQARAIGDACDFLIGHLGRS
jgi:dipeptidyl aminopeptidase/acylaminoacyl peptidase